MKYIITDGRNMAVINERHRAKLYYRTLTTKVPAYKVNVEVYDNEGISRPEEITYVRS